jgi:glutamine synthetase
MVSALGEKFVRAYTTVKRHELSLFNDHVTDWEERYLEVL